MPALLIGALPPPSPAACFHHESASLHLSSSEKTKTAAAAALAADTAPGPLVENAAAGTTRAYVSFSSLETGSGSLIAGGAGSVVLQGLREEGSPPTAAPHGLTSSFNATAVTRRRRPVCRICLLSVAITRAKPTSWDDAAIGEAIADANGASAAVFEGLFGDAHSEAAFPFEAQVMESRVLIDPKEKQVCGDRETLLPLPSSLSRTSHFLFLPLSLFQVHAVVAQWCETLRPNLILTIGGCGLGRGGSVPKAIRSLLSKEAPLLAGHLLKATADACGAELLVAEETVVGVCGALSAVVTLPSSATSVAPRSSVVATGLRELSGFLPRLITLMDNKGGGAKEI